MSLLNNQCCINISNIVVPGNINTDEWSLKYTLLNFSKMSVPFRHIITISPLYNEFKQPVYLMGISYNINECLTPIIPISRDLDGLKKELEFLNVAISITSPFSPFIIQYVNNKWQSLCGYKLYDVEGKTFKIIQGRDNKAVQNALQIKREIADIMMA